MKGMLRKLLMSAIMSIAIAYPLAATAQGKEKSADKKQMTEEEKAAADLEKALKRAKASEAFFATVSPLEVTLTMNIKRIKNDKGEDPPWRLGSFSYKDASGKDVSLPVQVRTRGIWRKKNCEMPPLRLNFKGEQTKGTLLEGIDKPKLVNYCKDTDEYEQYILQEAQLYRVYNLLTPASHRMRLLTVNYTDSASGKVYAKRAGILLEEPDVMAARNGGPILDLKGAVAEDLDPFHDALVGLFNFFIGNTDFSVYALHNVELVNQPSGTVIPVAGFGPRLALHSKTSSAALKRKIDAPSAQRPWRMVSSVCSSAMSGRSAIAIAFPICARSSVLFGSSMRYCYLPSPSSLIGDSRR